MSSSCVCKGDQRCMNCADQTPLLAPQAPSVSYPTLPSYNNNQGGFPTAPSPQAYNYPMAQPMYAPPPPPPPPYNNNVNGNPPPPFYATNGSSQAPPQQQQVCVVGHHHHHHHHHREGFIMNTLRLILFHFLNGVFSTVAFSFVTTGVALSIALLPLCCFGIVVFRVLLLFIGLFAQLDVRLYNLIAPKHQHVFVELADHHGFFAAAGTRLSPSLSSFSPTALLALLYFGTVKFVIGIFSFCALSMAMPLHIVIDDHHNVLILIGLVDSWDSDPVGFVLTTLLLMLFGIFLMRLVAKLSTSVTRFICCERFSIYQYVPVGQNDANGAYGPSYNSIA